LDEEPDWTQDRLFVNRDEIAADKEPEQIAVAPDIGKMEIQLFVVGFDDKRPLGGGRERGRHR
jgi:hypothetical protein